MASPFPPVAPSLPGRRRLGGALLGQLFLSTLAGLSVPGVARANPWRTPSPVKILSRFFQASDGTRLHYLEAGSGPRTLVFIPGWLMPAAIFGPQLAGLASRFRVIAFDPRSQGDSDLYQGSHPPELRMRDMEALLEAAKVEDFILAGWSLGVLESLDFLARHPNLPGLKGVILIDNSIGEGTPPQSPPAPKNKNAKKESRTESLTHFAHSMFKRQPPADIDHAVLDSVLRVPAGVANQLLRQPYPRTYWRDTVLAQTVPVLYAITPRWQEQGDILAAKKGDLAQVAVFGNAGHALFVDDAERFNQVVADFSERAFQRGD